MIPTADPLGPLWPTLAPARQEHLIDLANSMVALSTMRASRPAGEAEIAESMAAIAAVRREPGFEHEDDQALEVDTAIIRRLMRAILDGTAPPEVDRPESRHHTQAVHLVGSLVRATLEDDEDIAEAVRETATLLHPKVKPAFDLERVIEDATRMACDEIEEDDD